MMKPPRGRVFPTKDIFIPIAEIGPFDYTPQGLFIIIVQRGFLLMDLFYLDDFDSYWTQTSAAESLMGYINLDFDRCF